MLTISIPVPCHEDWYKMTPDETGRHCSSCAKSVVDFTGMNDEEVKYFFLNKKEEKVCGRFKQTQLRRIVIELPQNIFTIQMPIWKKFLAACLIAFSTTLFSCETKVTKGLTIPDVSMSSVDENKNDISGQVLISDTIPLIIPFCSTTLGITLQPVLTDSTRVVELQDDIAIIDIDSVATIPADTIPVPVQTKELIITGDTIYHDFQEKKLKVKSPVTAIKTKNPLKADSINCNTINNYY